MTKESLLVGLVILAVMCTALGYFIYLGWQISEDGQPDEAKEWEDLEGDELPSEEDENTPQEEDSLK